MQKEKNNAFGEKSRFSIEVKSFQDANKFYLRMWFDNNSIGDFNKVGSMDYIINTYFNLLENLNSLFEDKFYNMTDRQIFDDIVYDITIERSLEEENRLSDRMQMFAFEFGDTQFNDFTFLILHPKNGIKFLIYHMDGKSSPKLYSFLVEVDYFFSVYKEFVLFAFENGLKKHHPFFPTGFSYEDIK